MENGKKGTKVVDEFPNEQAIFAFLKMQYKEPRERIDGRAVKFISGPVPVPATLAAAPVPGPPPLAKIKRKTIKNKKSLIIMPDNLSSLLAAFKAQGPEALKTEDELSQLLRAANDAYYCNQQPLLTDNAYDILREYTLARYPENEAALAGHAQCVITEKNKVQLP